MLGNSSLTHSVDSRVFQRWNQHLHQHISQMSHFPRKSAYVGSAMSSATLEFIRIEIHWLIAEQPTVLLSYDLSAANDQHISETFLCHHNTHLREELKYISISRPKHLFGNIVPFKRSFLHRHCLEEGTLFQPFI